MLTFRHAADFQYGHEKHGGNIFAEQRRTTVWVRNSCAGSPSARFPFSAIKTVFFSFLATALIPLTAQFNSPDSTGIQKNHTGTISFSVAKTDGATELLANGIASQLKLKGNFNLSKPMNLQYKRPFSQYVLSHELTIFAHHGVLTTANPPYAQNSILGAINDQDLVRMPWNLMCGLLKTTCRSACMMPPMTSG